MNSFLIDTNILLDVLTENPIWMQPSADLLSRCINDGKVFVNPIIYSEVSVGFEKIEEVEEVLPHHTFLRASLPWEACFLAGKCFLLYRKRGGNKTSPLPDFFIGAHAAVSGLTLATRDVARYRTYFPTVKLITVET